MVLERSADASLAFLDPGTAAAVLVGSNGGEWTGAAVLAGVALLLLASAVVVVVVVVLKRRFALASASEHATSAPSEVC